MNAWLGTLLIGIGATATTDLWAIARKRIFAIAPPNYGLVGRWLAHMPRGRFVHASIAAAPTAHAERGIGWTAHYFIGIAFAVILLGVYGIEWLNHPTLAPALIVGVASVGAPFLLMQPGMGLGIAARRAPRPWVARTQSLITHAIFGLGFYVSAIALNCFR